MSSTSFRTAPSYRVDLPESSRQSTSEPLELVLQGMSSRPPSDTTPDNTTDLVVQGVQFSKNQIPHGVYESRRPYSPTASDMNLEV